MKLIVNNQSIEIEERDMLVSGTINEYEAIFEFSADWDGYSKVAVFENQQGQVFEQLLVNDTCVIPWEVLVNDGFIKVGCYGTSGDKTKPTIYTVSNVVYNGVKNASDSYVASPTMYAQLANRIEQLEGGALDEWHQISLWEDGIDGPLSHAYYRLNGLGGLDVKIDETDYMGPVTLHTMTGPYIPTFKTLHYFEKQNVH